MLVPEPGVPIHFCEIELERAPALVHLNLRVRRSREHLHGERTELGLGTHVFDLVDDGGDTRVLIDYDGRDQVLVGGVLRAEVEMGEVSGLREGLRNLRHEIFGED